MNITLEAKQAWETWLSERPENIRKVATSIVPWKMYRDKTIAEDIGNRYSPRSYEEHKDGTVTITCKKTNNKTPLLGGYMVFGINPGDLVESD